MQSNKCIKKNNINERMAVKVSAKELNDKRKRKFRIRIHEPAFDFLEILRKAGQSEFILMSKWFSLDWILDNNTNYLKVLEGNYDPKTPTAHEPDHTKYLAEREKQVQKARELAKR